MRRRLFAAAWIVGATVPLLLAAVFLFGCCALPFHHVVHKLMPVCDFAASLLRGDAEEEQHDATPPEAPVKRLVTRVPSMFRLAAATSEPRILAPVATTSYRSFITLGAMRCDRDVGLHVLVETFLI
jgi:hypothetical protein